MIKLRYSSYQLRLLLSMYRALFMSYQVGTNSISFEDYFPIFLSFFLDTFLSTFFFTSCAKL